MVGDQLMDVLVVVIARAHFLQHIGVCFFERRPGFYTQSNVHARSHNAAEHDNAGVGKVTTEYCKVATDTPDAGR